jgi:PAS domain S-box-containing protein
MAVEMISELLAATDLRGLAKNLAKRLRELTGARTVLLVNHRDEPAAHEVVHASPPGRATPLSACDLGHLCVLCEPEALPSNPDELPTDHPLRAPLLRDGVKSLLRFPLCAGGELQGSLLLLDLPGFAPGVDTDEAFQKDAVEAVTLLSAPIALAVRNALAEQKIEEQRGEIQGYAYELERRDERDRRVANRTAELEAANKNLVESHSAAIEMMNQAVAARRHAEETTVALQREMAERKRAEEALLENEEKFRTLFENAGDAILLMQDDRFIDCNVRTMGIFGCQSRDQIVGHSPYEFSPPLQPNGRDSRVFAIERITAALAGRPQFFEWMHTKLDGTPFPAEVSLNAVRLGDRVLLQAIVRDITDGKRVEDALRESERKYRELVEHANSIILHWTRDGRILFLNEFGQRFFGYTEAEICGRHVIGTLVPETESGGRDLHLLMDRICANPAHFAENVNENMRRNGERVWIAWTNKVMLDPKGQVAEILSIGVDITARRRAEAEICRRSDELAALNALGRQVSQSLSLDAVVSVAVREMVKTVQADAAFLFLRNGNKLTAAGIDPQGVATKFGEMPEHRVGECMCGLAVREGRPLYSRDIHADPRCTWDECKQAGFRSFAALPLRSGTEIIGVAGLACRAERDFEPQAGFLETLASQVASGIRNALLYAEVQRYAGDLEQRVGERTAQLTSANEQLLAENAARKQAEAIVRARNEELKGFAYTVSHDLKAPLRGIAGYAQELERRHKAGLAERAQFCITQIITATKNLDGLIEDLLHYSRLDAETLSITEVNLTGMVEAILKDRSLVIAQQHTEVTVQISTSTLETWERGLVQVLTNLIDNAIKYSRKAQPPRVSITAEELPGICRVTVTDNGIGFDMKYGDRIFGLFNRLVRADEFEGTGAGLAIVKKVIGKLGGSIRVESAPGQGATFTVELPSPPRPPSPP